MTYQVLQDANIQEHKCHEWQKVISIKWMIRYICYLDLGVSDMGMHLTRVSSIFYKVFLYIWRVGLPYPCTLHICWHGCLKENEESSNKGLDHNLILTQSSRFWASTFKLKDEFLWPLISSRTKTPKLNTSAFTDRCPCMTYSGAIYPLFPNNKIHRTLLNQHLRTKV